MSTKEEQTTNSTTGRGTVSSRGRGGGFMPKKKLHEQIQSLELTSTEESKSEENIVKEKFRIQEESDESDNDSDSETDQNKKRCDFCGDTNHQDRFCPLLQKKDDGHKQGKISNKQQISCFYCHGEGHVRADCPKRALAKCCFYCKKEGHIKADCPEKAAREAKKRERVMLNYTFRKASQKETKTCSTMSGNNVADVFYQGPEENSGAVESKPRVIVPYPVKASQAKSEVKLRSKLLASESDPSIPRKILRSESSEEEEEMESVDSDENSKENNEEVTKMEDQNGEQKVKAGNGEEELQTISIEVDGCVEFDSGDDRSYYDCSEGEDDGDGRKRAMEADELYGEDGALISEGEEPIKEEGKKEEEQIAKQE